MGWSWWTATKFPDFLFRPRVHFRFVTSSDGLSWSSAVTWNQLPRL
jgi:hypothetical protein